MQSVDGQNGESITKEVTVEKGGGSGGIWPGDRIGKGLQEAKT